MTIFSHSAALNCVNVFFEVAYTPYDPLEAAFATPFQLKDVIEC